MAHFTHVDPTKLKTGAANTSACLGELESNLNGLSSAADELYVAVSGATGTAINNALSEAFAAGKSLGATLQEIIDALTETGVKIDAHDLDSAAEVVAASGGENFVPSGSNGFQSGADVMSTQAMSKVDTTSY
ncbi:hypothetical protein OG874_22380 [Nocardia sp. NBC_00565]|uniref:WXG100 family type VII secretion target n=1 Tax=Nocardia sp. NBC_00565 TaxID=2975993 RepID=UPI002E81F86C|nr:hypothetical protein [Nocardia sp. NBC_00565]WUC07666.1 hypothetical protein OG874_22380 [Nocardia sp. NBC_00565]